jgi:hypothetical protein
MRWKIGINGEDLIVDGLDLLQEAFTEKTEENHE